MSELVLPTKKEKAGAENPRMLLLYGQPKVGKTSLLSGLDNNLIVDMDPLGGTDFYESMAVKARSIADLRAIINAIYNQPQGTYDYITLDPITDLEEIALELACAYYKRTPDGKTWSPIDPDTGKKDYRLVTDLPYGAGYKALRDAFTDLINNFYQAAKYHNGILILSAHVKDKYISKEGVEVQAADINLTGKIKNIVAGLVDAVAYLKRKESGVNILSFKTSDDALCGSRIPRLSGQEIEISKKVGDTVETYWDKVFV